MQGGYNDRSRYVLMIEDSAEDYNAAASALGKAGLSYPVRRCANGEEALALLQAGENLPGLILLDLRLPGYPGHEVLKKIKSNDNFKHIPVVVLSVSGDKDDIAACYDEGASSYLRKPENSEGFVNVAQTLKSFWFDQAILPAEA